MRFVKNLNIKENENGIISVDSDKTGTKFVIKYFKELIYKNKLVFLGFSLFSRFYNSCSTSLFQYNYNWIYENNKLSKNNE